MWGLTYSSGWLGAVDVWPTGTVAGGGADASGWGGGGAAIVSGLIEPRCLDGSRLSVIASGGWIGSYSSVASFPAYFLHYKNRFDCHFVRLTR